MEERQKALEFERASLEKLKQEQVAQAAKDAARLEEAESEGKQDERAGKQRSQAGCLGTSNRDDAAEGETCGTMLCSS